MTMDEIIQAAAKLPKEDRRKIADALTAGLKAPCAEHEDDPKAFRQAWNAEVAKRSDQIRTGKVKTIPADETEKRMFNGDTRRRTRRGEQG